MYDINDFGAMMEELHVLREAYRKLTLENKKTARALDLAQKQIQRNNAASEAKDNLSRVVSVKRSELERYMNLLLGNCPDIILLFDWDGRIAYCTDSFLKGCGLPGFGIIKGMLYSELLRPYAPEAFLDRLREVVERISDEKRTVNFSDTLDFGREGNARSYSIQASPMLGEHGAVEGSMLIMSDTTEILQARNEAERANAAKSDFLAVVSHEIRTPMNAIVGVSEMLKSTGLTACQLDHLNTIQNSSHILLNLINDILDFSKIEAGKLELIPDYFRLGDLLKHLRSMFEPMAQQKDLAFLCMHDDSLPDIVYGDDKRVRQILTNILNNALKYTKQGSVFFRASRQADGQLRFEVEDTGIGIRPEALPKLFTAFEQLDLVRNKSVIGTGLGLAITKRLCDLMNGEIQVKSEYEKGSLFSIILPLSEGSEADLGHEGNVEALSFKAPDAHVLIVDDIEVNLHIAAFMLELFGISSDFAISGREALDKVLENRYDMVFMDHMMPEMDGIEATQRIRAMGGYPARMPIVALSANAVSSAVETFLTSGFNDFLSKPMDHATLAQCLLKWIPEDKIVYSS